MATFLTIQHPSINGGVPVNVLCNKLTITGTKHNAKDPNATITGSIVEVQTQSIENPIYTLSGVYFTNASGTLTYPMLLTLYKLRYGGVGVTGTDQAIVMRAVYGQPGSEITLVGADGVTTSLKVIISSFNFPIDMSNTKDGYIPIGSITLIETL
jgi:hypothetical protein